MIPTDLFSYAYIPAWYEQLNELSQLAAPEPWRFRQPTYETQNDQNPILERYINQVFRKQSVKYIKALVFCKRLDFKNDIAFSSRNLVA